MSSGSPDNNVSIRSEMHIFENLLQQVADRQLPLNNRKDTCL